MRNIFLALLMFCSLSVFAQPRAITFQDAEKEGLTVQKLDKLYGNAVDTDSTKAVFKGTDSKTFYNAYVTLLTDMSAYMQQNGFQWGKPTRMFHRIYFEPDGTIDYYLLNIKPAGLTEEKEKQFMTLLNGFIKDYKIKITANKKFAQCSPAIYQDAK
jgi:hypothetical protein